MSEVPEFYTEKDIFGLDKPKISIEKEKFPFSATNEKELAAIYGSARYRFFAYLVDYIILMSILLVIKLAFFDTRTNSFINDMILVIFTKTLYYGIMESSTRQASIGKIIFGLIVIDKNGNRISFQRACLRSFSRLLSTLPFGYGLWVIANDKKKQGWHDLLFDCYIINKKTLKTSAA